MKKHLLLILPVLTLLLFHGCQQENIIIEPEVPVEYQPDETVPDIPKPTGPYVISELQSEKKFVAISGLLDQVQVDLLVSRSGEGGFFVDTSFVLPVKVPQDSFRVYMRHRKYWQNLGSRVLGPGTSYSITYTYTEGTSTTNTSEFSYSLGFDASFGGIGLSASMSQSFSTEVTIFSERSTEETQTVEGLNGFYRVYTVWQLVNEYDFVDQNGNELSGSRIDNIPMIKNAVEMFKDAPVKIKGLDMPSLIVGTPVIYQLTYDFPITE